MSKFAGHFEFNFQTKILIKACQHIIQGWASLHG